MVDPSAGKKVEKEGTTSDSCDDTDRNLLGIDQRARNDIRENNEAGTAEDGSEQKAAVIDSEDEPNGMGHNEADEAYDAGHCHGGGRCLYEYSCCSCGGR